MNKAIRFLSVFAGIGGCDLGLKRAGWRCVGQIEIDPFCRQVLAKRWPHVTRFEDVREVTGELIRERCGDVDAVVGGFPCQDISAAGKKAGITGERSGLWIEFYRVICELRPRVIIVENTAALLARGIDRVLSDLAEGGFDAEWSVLSACALGAPHTRERVFIVAYPNGIYGETGMGFQSKLFGQVSEINNQHRNGNWLESDAPACRMVNGIPARVDRVRSIGNSVVPVWPEAIGRVVNAALNNP